MKSTKGRLSAIALGAVCLAGSHGPALAWGGEHSLISRTALAALPAAQREVFRPEATAIADIYCTFPDQNWPNQGQWGAGNGDPAGPRLPDFRREWEVSRTCAWDPVLRKGRPLVHAPPASLEATALFFGQALQALQAGNLEDAARSVGVMLHYVQDSGSFAHMQPFHRATGVKEWKSVDLAGYAPRVLAENREGAPAAAARRVEQLVAFTEERLSALLASPGTPAAPTLAQVKERCARETAPADLMAFVAALRKDRADEWQALTLAACLESCRACADIFHTLLRLAPASIPEPPPHPVGKDLLFNPSFEEDDGDGVPDGWVAGWLDLADRAGRAECYRAGTHWTRHVHGGERSLLLLWAPEKGLEWRQTWPRAVRVRPGERYQGSAWVESRCAGGEAWIGVQCADTDYRVLGTERCPPIVGETDWHQMRFEVTVPERARWLRVLLHSTMRDGAVWFDDVSLMRME